MGTRRIALSSLLALAASLVLSSPASAAPGKLVLDGCQSSASGPPVPGCTALQGLGRTGAVAFSADGRSAYASFPGGISAFDRNPVTGELSFLECLDAAGAPPCAPLPGALATPGFMGTASDLVVPHDGASLYAATGNQTSLVGFTRDPGGGLEFAYCRHSSYGATGDLPSCPIGEFEEVRQLEASLDGRAIYIADRGCADNTGDCFSNVKAYLRDPATSVLSEGRGSSPATYGTGPFAVKGGAGTVYQVDSEVGTISVFKRIEATGFKRVQCLWPRSNRGFSRCVPTPAMRRATAIALSPDGRLVVTGVRDKGWATLALFARARNGKLSFRRALPPVKGLGVAKIDQLEFAANGRSLYAVGGRNAGEPRILTRFRVNAKRGRVAFAQCLAAGTHRLCDAVPQLNGLTEITLGGGLVYATVADPNAGTGPNALVRFRPQPKR